MSSLSVVEQRHYLFKFFVCYANHGLVTILSVILIEI